MIAAGMTGYQREANERNLKRMQYAQDTVQLALRGNTYLE